MQVVLAPRVFFPQGPRALQVQVEMRADTVEVAVQDTMVAVDQVRPQVLARVGVEDPHW